MNAESKSILDLHGSTDKIFLKEEITRMSVQQVDKFYAECIDVLFRLMEVRNTLVPEGDYVTGTPVDFGPGEFMLWQVATLENFVSSTLSVEFVTFEETQVSTKPVCSDKLHIFIELYKVLWDKCNKAATDYYLDESEVEDLRKLTSDAIYNLVTFVIVQFNLECAVLGWEPNEELDSEICSTVVMDCEASGNELDAILGFIRDTYDATRPSIPELDDKPSKYKRFVDLVGYLIFELGDVPELATSPVISAVLAGRISVDEYNGRIYEAIAEKYSLV